MRLIWFLALPILTACSDRAPGDAPHTTPASAYNDGPASGETVARIAPSGEAPATLRSGPRVPITLPPGFTLYPGAAVVSNAVVERSGRRRFLLVFKTADSIAQVLGFYRGQARQAGMTVAIDLGGDERASLGGRHPSGGDVVISARREGTKTRVEFAHM